VFGVVFRRSVIVQDAQFGGGEPQTFSLQSPKDLAHESPLDPVGFDDHQRLIHSAQI
jgi:hypothetical protein